MTNLSLDLRQATHSWHEQLERLPFAQAMVRGPMSREGYGHAFAQVLQVHDTLEEELRQWPTLVALFGECLDRSQTLSRDLRTLGHEGFALPWPETQRFQAFLRSCSIEPSGWPLVGCLYVFEGSRMGSMVLGPALAQSLGVSLQSGTGLDYHWEGVRERPAAWKRFKDHLDRAVPPEAYPMVRQAAVDTMAHMHALYSAFTPLVSGIPLAETV